ncbi:hypothetical protein [Mycobacterium intracellulare]|uniref:hypothetical protein n=1 Tax=Mycobacterium intracellulare TaxID=1767 RepID=UPI00109E79FE|nr:hypothetical protein [Mycobacterium intracellulare]
MNRDMTMYQVTDRLHCGRAAQVTGDEIGNTVAEWLADLGVHSPMVEDLTRAVRVGDWPLAHRLANFLSVDITLA